MRNMATNYEQELNHAISSLNEETGKLASWAEISTQLGSIHADVKSEIELLSGATSSIEKAEKALKGIDGRVQDVVDNEKNSRDDFLQLVRRTIADNTESNMRMFSTLSSSVTVATTEINNNVIQKSSQVIESVFDNANKNAKGSIAAINELKQTISEANEKREKENEVLKTQMLRTQLFAKIAIAASATACIIGVVQLFI